MHWPAITLSSILQVLQVFWPLHLFLSSIIPRKWMKSPLFTLQFISFVVFLGSALFKSRQHWAVPTLVPPTSCLSQRSHVSKCQSLSHFSFSGLMCCRTCLQTSTEVKKLGGGLLQWNIFDFSWIFFAQQIFQRHPFSSTTRTEISQSQEGYQTIRTVKLAIFIYKADYTEYS